MMGEGEKVLRLMHPSHNYSHAFKLCYILSIKDNFAINCLNQLNFVNLAFMS
jgi:hypothetical protein